MRRAAVPLAGAILLVAVALARLPSPRELVRRAATPFDRTRDPGAGPAFVLLTEAAPRIPPGASVAVRAASGSADQTAYCTLLASSLLPDRRIAAAETPVEAARPDYVVVIGADAAARPGARDGFGRLVLATPRGAVWRRIE